VGCRVGSPLSSSPLLQSQSSIILSSPPIPVLHHPLLSTDPSPPSSSTLLRSQSSIILSSQPIPVLSHPLNPPTSNTKLTQPILICSILSSDYQHQHTCKSLHQKIEQLFIRMNPTTDSNYQLLLKPIL